MKKIFFAMLLACTALTSCDMDKSPLGALDDQSAIQSLNDCSRFRNNLYGDLRGLTNGSYIYLRDLQGDQFQATKDYGNRNGIIHDGTFSSSADEFTGTWSSCYSVINSVNYFLEHANKLAESEKINGDDLLMLNRYIGEAKFVRGYCYYILADRFCEQYTSTIAETPAKGLPLVSVYKPTGDISAYPGRSTQKETYAFIQEDLNAAYTALTAYEKNDPENLAPNSSYLSSNVVLALQARIALNNGDNALAVQKAESVINSGHYALAEMGDFDKMWSEDVSTEAIFRPYMDIQELGPSVGGAYLSPNLDNADYIPAFETISMFDPKKDIRFATYFKVWKLKIESKEYAAYVFTKFPGNESLKTDSRPNYVNMSKPFRLAELYLIVAEAASQTDPAKANKYLNALKKKRIADYKDANLSGLALVDAVQEERQRELLGEGFRLSDLRRWGQGFVRGVKHPENPSIEKILAVNGKGLSYDKGDHRYVWPIPTDEIQSNPQMKDQQNPGY